MFAIHVKAVNDTNGNPRRLFLVCSEHGPVVSINEDNYGPQAIDLAGYFAPVVSDIHVQPAEYKRLLRMYPPSKVATAKREHREYHAHVSARRKRGIPTY